MAEYKYQHPYPSQELEATHPFRQLDFDAQTEETMMERARGFSQLMATRRSVRMFSDTPVPRSLIEEAIRTGSTAPSGAHKQPWRWVAISDPETKRAIRLAA